MRWIFALSSGRVLRFGGRMRVVQFGSRVCLERSLGWGFPFRGFIQVAEARENEKRSGSSTKGESAKGTA